MIGRRAEVAELRNRLAGEHRLVTVTGPAGIGKSRVATAAADELGRAFSDGVHRVALDEVRSGDALGPAVARAIGVSRRTSPWEVEHVVGAIGGRQVLLVLDGCDHLVEPGGRLITTLLSRCPRLKVLVTSRQLLNIHGESVLTLGPLDHPEPGTGSLTAEALSKYDAVHLFVRRAARLVPSFRLDDVNAPAVAGITAAVGGVPLAVELAAARVPVLSPHAILERLGDPYRLLTKGAREAPERFRSLRASVDASAELCTDDERELWGRMSVFAGTFELDAVEAVCAGEGIGLLEVLDLVDSLLEKSVLMRDGSDPLRVRYSMLEPLRTYGAELLGDRADQWRARHRQWFVELAREASAGWFSPEQSASLRRLSCEHANLVAAMEDALRSDPGPLVGPVVALEPYWVTSGRIAEARDWLLRAGRLLGDETARAEAVLAAGWYAAIQADVADAVVLRAEAEVHGARKVPRLVPSVLRLDAGVAMWEGRHGDAEDAFSQVADIARADGDLAAEATALLLLGLTRSLARDVGAAAGALRACLELTEAAGEDFLRSYALTVFAVNALVQGEAGIADEPARRALRIKAALADRFAVALLIEVLACIAAAVDQPLRAATLLGAAAARWRALGLEPEELPRMAGLRKRAVALTRDALGGQGYEARWRLGERLPDEQAVRFALDDVLLAPEPPGVAEETPLTPREAEVAELVGHGLSNREIAERLVISRRTAQGHVENILRKLGFGSRAQVAAWVAARAAGAARRE